MHEIKELTLLLALSLVGLPGLSSCRSPATLEPSPESPRAVPAAAVPAAAMVSTAEPYVGVVVARQAVDIAGEVEGTLAGVDVRVGDRVSRNSRLASMETRDLSQELTRSRAAASGAAADSRRIEVELRRAEEQLRRRQALPDLFAQEELESAVSERDMAAAALESARARVDEQQAQVTQLESRLHRSVLRAPIDGSIAARFLDPGAQIRPGTPVLRLIASDEFVLRFAVPPPVAARMQPGDLVEASLDAMDWPLQATVSQIAPQVDAASQMIFIEADLDLPPTLQAQLQDGLVARIREKMP